MQNVSNKSWCSCEVSVLKEPWKKSINFINTAVPFHVLLFLIHANHFFSHYELLLDHHTSNFFTFKFYFINQEGGSNSYSISFFLLMMKWKKHKHNFVKYEIVNFFITSLPILLVDFKLLIHEVCRIEKSLMTLLHLIPRQRFIDTWTILWEPSLRSIIVSIQT